MSHIGCDIVSLKHFSPRGLYERDSYLRKAYTSAEISQIEENPDIAAVFWATKESAYKLHSKTGGEGAFSPGLFECHIIENQNTEHTNCFELHVTRGARTYCARAEAMQEAVICRATEKSEPEACVQHVIKRLAEHEDASISAREILALVLNPELSFEEIPSIIDHPEEDYPRINPDINSPFEDFSISHDHELLLITLLRKEAHV